MTKSNVGLTPVGVALCVAILMATTQHTTTPTEETQSINAVSSDTGYYIDRQLYSDPIPDGDPGTTEPAPDIVNGTEVVE